MIYYPDLEELFKIIYINYIDIFKLYIYRFVPYFASSPQALKLENIMATAPIG